jgi:hypothetical protein
MSRSESDYSSFPTNENDGVIGGCITYCDERAQDQSQANGTVVPGRKPDASGKTAQENGFGHPCCTAKTGTQESVLGNGLHE